MTSLLAAVVVAIFMCCGGEAGWLAKNSVLWDIHMEARGGQRTQAVAHAHAFPLPRSPTLPLPLPLPSCDAGCRVLFATHYHMLTEEP